MRRLLPVADELIITTNEPENLGFLADEFPGQDIILVRDAYDFRGALPGLCGMMPSDIHGGAFGKRRFELGRV